MRKKLETIKIKRDRTFRYSLLTNTNRKKYVTVFILIEIVTKTHYMYQ